MYILLLVDLNEVGSPMEEYRTRLRSHALILHTIDGSQGVSQRAGLVKFNDVFHFDPQEWELRTVTII